MNKQYTDVTSGEDTLINKHKVFNNPASFKQINQSSLTDIKDRKKSQFTIVNLLINFIIISSLVFINAFGELGNYISLVILGIMAISSVSNALKVISLLGLIIMANPYIVEKSIAFTFLRFPILGLAGGRVLWDVVTKRPELLRLPYLNALLLFGLVCVLLAPINGYFVQIAVLKAVLFTFGAYVVLIGTELNRSRFSDLTVWFFSLFLFFVIGTFLTYPLGISHVFRGEINHFSSSSGLSGITTHQQTMGSFSAMIAVFSFTVGVFSKLRYRWIFILILLVVFPFAYLTRSRTAVGTLVISIMVIILLAPVVVRKRKAIFNKISPIRWMLFGVIFLVLGYVFDLATGGTVSTRIFEFALKGMAGKVSSFNAEDLTVSRIGLIEQSWYVFKQSPLTGINFGTSLNSYFIETASAFSAPTEKGFLPTAILEEVGIIGTFFFLIFIGLLIRKLFVDENIIGLGVFVAFLIQNMGEMMFFSFGGAGMFCWSIVGAGIAVGYRHQFIRRVQQ